MATSTTSDIELENINQESIGIVGEENAKGLRALAEASEKKENWVTKADIAKMASDDGSSFRFDGILNCKNEKCSKQHQLLVTYTVSVGMLIDKKTGDATDVPVRHLTVSVDGNAPHDWLAMAAAFQLGFRPGKCQPSITRHPEGGALVVIQPLDFDDERFAVPMDMINTNGMDIKEFQISDLKDDPEGISQLERILIRPILTEVMTRAKASPELTEVIISLAMKRPVENAEQVGVSEFFLSIDKNPDLKEHDKKLLRDVRKTAMGF